MPCSPRKTLAFAFSMTVQGWWLEPGIQQQRESRVRGMELRRQQDLQELPKARPILQSGPKAAVPRRAWCHLVVLEVRSPKISFTGLRSRCQRDWFTPEALRGDSISLLFSASGGLDLWTLLIVHRLSLCFRGHTTFSPSASHLRGCFWLHSGSTWIFSPSQDSRLNHIRNVPFGI